jgi:4-carboxymuconolactone decarboxylase
MAQDDLRAAAAELYKSWSSKALTDMETQNRSEFCSDLGQIALDNAFKLWVREGLDLRARSLVTLGILIALRAYEELRVHIPIALQNGCTLRELEEVIYHATAYAGFPAANTARRAAVDTLRAEKLID